MRNTECTQMRRKLVTHSTLNIVTGETGNERTKWVTETCGSPLFGADEKEAGKCRSCLKGWTHEHNYPVED